MRLTMLLIAGLAIAFASCKSGSHKGGKPKMKDAKDSFSYALGLNNAESLKAAHIKEINYDAFLAGLKEGMSKDSGFGFTKEQQREAFVRYATMMKDANDKESKTKADKFLADKKSGGYSVTPSGILYKAISNGNGAKPTLADTVKINFHITFMDGKQFESNKGMPAIEWPVNREVFKAFPEMLQMMPVGSKYQFIVPYDMAYGKEGQADPRSGTVIVEPYAPLIVELELTEIVK